MTSLFKRRTSQIRLHAFAAALVLLVAAPAFGQIGYGLKAGVNVSNVSFEADEDVPSSARMGLLAGGFATIRLGWLTVQPEAIYTVKGASLDVLAVESDYIVDYLDVPVLARFSVRRNLYMAAGPSMSYRLRARGRTSFSGSTEEIDLDDDVESFDLGIVGAAGVEFGRWVVDGRYTHGLTDTDADPSDFVKIRNRVFSLSAGIKF